MPAPTYINIEYFFYKTFIFLKNVYFFVIRIPWLKVVSWGNIIGGIIVIIFVSGVIYNLIGIYRVRKHIKEHSEFDF